MLNVFSHGLSFRTRNIFSDISDVKFFFGNEVFLRSCSSISETEYFLEKKYLRLHEIVSDMKYLEHEIVYEKKYIFPKTE